jgi:hypothetical protein
MLFKDVVKKIIPVILLSYYFILCLVAYLDSYNELGPFDMSFIIQYWKQMLIFIGVLGIISFCLYVQDLRTDKARLQEEAESYQALISKLIADLAANQQALKTRALEIENLSREKDKAMAELESVYKADPNACDWRDVKIPESIQELLKK